MDIGSGVRILVSELGGRIFGPFPDQSEVGLFWCNSAFESPDSFEDFINGGSWNQGGERCWIAPEIQYNIRDRSDFWGSYHLPPEMDPGHYELTRQKGNRLKLSQTVDLRAYNIASGTKHLYIERTLSPVHDPFFLSGLKASISCDYIFAGYEHAIRLRDESPDHILSEVWSLVQLNPGGTLIIPSMHHAHYTDYFEPLCDNFFSSGKHVFQIRITGDRRFKIGLKSLSVIGRMGYINSLPDGRVYIIIRDFRNDPSALYSEEPVSMPGNRGHSIHVYNDGGALGGFGEMECHGSPVGTEAGMLESNDRMLLWLYIGKPDCIHRIAEMLLGVTSPLQ